MARVFVIVGGLLVLVLLAALIAPLFINWTGYRADFEREASKILGRPVTVAGEASARLLPFPSLSFTNVRVGEDVENPALTIEQFSMDAELSPFLSGEVLIFDMRMTKPRGVVVIDESGQIDWTLRANSPFDPGNVRIENLVVEGGQFDVIDRAAGR
ncbi:MAG: AsmA family protein, partial [Rhizobiaceae bacterium]